MSENFQAIAFTNEAVTITGQIQSGQNLGYHFPGEVGKTLNFKTEDDLCVWVFSPSGQILTDFKLAETAQYIVQIAAKRGNQTFDIQLTLKDPAQNNNISEQPSSEQPSTEQPSSSRRTFSKSDYPKAVCGDSRPRNLSAYPVEFYPVNLRNTTSNLRRAQSKFCADAYIKKSKNTGKRIIQVASFTSKQTAQNFANFVNTELSGATVGPPSTIEQP